MSLDLLIPSFKRRRCFVSKWEPFASLLSDFQVVADFQQTLQGPLDSAKRAALRALMKFNLAGFECMFEEAC